MLIFHMNESVKGIYPTIIGIDILTEQWWSLKFSEHVIKADDEPLKGS